MDIEAVLKSVRGRWPDGDVEALRAALGHPDAERVCMEIVQQHAPAVGKPAPDFDLPRLREEGRVRLSDHRGRPVGLVFGSYT